MSRGSFYPRRTRRVTKDSAVICLNCDSCDHEILLIVGRPSSLDFRERRPMCSPVIPARAGMTVRCCQNQDLQDLWDGRMGQSKGAVCRWCQNQDLQDVRDFQDGLVGGWVVVVRIRICGICGMAGWDSRKTLHQVALRLAPDLPSATTATSTVSSSTKTATSAATSSSECWDSAVCGLVLPP